MKKLSMLAATILVWSVFSGNSAYALRSITDTYIGSGDSRDIVGDPAEFSVDAMEIDLTDEWDMTVNITTNYVEGAEYTQYGDLFISTDGWNPYGESPYAEDNYLNGEDWEYVFDVSEGKLFDIRADQDHILLSDDIFLSGHRSGHEVLIDPYGLTAIADGTSARNGDLYSMNFNIAEMFADQDILDFGFHWTMTCANDIIEGPGGLAIDKSYAQVPEPGTVMLLGVGLVGLVSIKRKQANKQPGV